MQQSTCNAHIPKYGGGSIFGKRINTTHETIGGGANCNWFGLLGVSSIDKPVDVDRAFVKTQALNSQHRAVDDTFHQNQFIQT